MGKSKNSIPEWYLGLKLQTPILVKNMSQIMKKIAVIQIAEKTDFQRFIYLILLSKLYRKGIIKDPIFRIKYSDIYIL